MDFTDQYPFPQQAFNAGVMNIPPLTPSHSQSAPSEDFTSPPDNAFAQLGADFTNFDYTQGLGAGAFPGPPTPPNAYSQKNGGPATNASPEDSGARGGSEEDDLTPAQSRRKAQNRAAQRAFRERKERHVKDLEAKLASMEAAQQETSLENERLKRDLQKMSTENEILRATSGSSPQVLSRPEPATTGPMSYKPTDFYSDVLKGHENQTPSHRIVVSSTGERLYAAGATWDFIIGHDLYKRGLVNVGDVSERLKAFATCDGQGPVFPERAIVSAIEQSVASGSDDLL